MTERSNQLCPNTNGIGTAIRLWFRWLLLATLVLSVSTSLQGVLAGQGWWLAAPADAAWTNKSTVELRAAAERGDAAAQFYYARALFIGAGRQRNPPEALRWTRLAAEQGYVEAQYTLARFHYEAIATPHDHDEAFSWLSRAVKQGHVEAMTVMGWAYATGEGVPLDGIKAREWLERALNAGARSAAWQLGFYYLNGEAGLARRTNYVEALQWFERAATNNPNALLTVADLVEQGLGTPPDFVRALQGYRRCADIGNMDAMERLASIYSAGKAEPRGPDDAPIVLMRRAAVGRAVDSFAAGQRSLALLESTRELWNRYRLGIGTTRDYVAAAEWMWVAYRANLLRDSNPDGGRANRAPLEHPFDSILAGKATAYSADERLWQQAVRLVNSALEQNRAESWHQIGEGYRDGSSLAPKQPLMAWAWFARAAELNLAAARTALQALEANLTPDEITKAKQFWVPVMKRQDAP